MKGPNAVAIVALESLRENDPLVWPPPQTPCRESKKAFKSLIYALNSTITQEEWPLPVQKLYQHIRGCKLCLGNCLEITERDDREALLALEEEVANSPLRFAWAMLNDENYPAWQQVFLTNYFAQLIGEILATFTDGGGYRLLDPEILSELERQLREAQLTLTCPGQPVIRKIKG